ncbi:MAG: hypothetical protein PHT60_13960 [Acidiphilium sp.]|nr:hypothetical protein [Acidiphilium sp.]MDD4936870.1 hypothetical protein [Acidiphilium sp.]
MTNETSDLDRLNLELETERHFLEAERRKEAQEQKSRESVVRVFIFVMAVGFVILSALIVVTSPVKNPWPF